MNKVLVNFGDLIFNGEIEVDKMRNDNFETRLTSYDEVKHRVISAVKIDCENFDTFKQIVEAVMPILEKEDVKECPKK